MIAEFQSKSEKNRSIIGISLMLLLLFLVPEIMRLYNRHVLGITEINLTLFLVSRLFYWICLIGMWFYTLKIEKRSFILYAEKKHEPWKYFLFFISTFMIIVTGLIIIGLLVLILKSKKESDNLKQIVEILRDQNIMIFFTAATAGIVEELLFRGYLQPRLEQLFKNKWIAILIGSVLFGLLHYGYGTVINILGPFFIGFVFAVFYDKFRSLKFLIFFHFLWDFVILLFQTNKQI